MSVDPADWTQVNWDVRTVPVTPKGFRAFTPTSPATSSAAARDMADVLLEIEKIVADGADPSEVYRRIVEDGGDPQAVEGLVLNWLELRFSHLIGMVSIAPDPERQDRHELVIAGYDGDHPYRLAVNIPPVLRDVQEGWWS